VKLLIVEDESIVSDLYIRLLGPLFDTIVVVTSPEQLRALLAVPPPPDVVLFDLIGGAKAVEDIRTIRETHPDTVVVVASGNSSPEIIQAAIQRGADYYAVKPETGTRDGVIRAILQGAKKRTGRIALIERLTAAMASTPRSVSKQII